MKARSTRSARSSSRGNKLFSTPEIVAGMKKLHTLKRTKGKLGPNGFEMDVGDTFTPKGLTKDTEGRGLLWRPAAT